MKTESTSSLGSNKLSEHEFKFAFENNPVAMSFVSSDLRFVHVNNAFCKLLGYKDHEIVGRSILELTHPDDRARSEELKRGLLSGEIKLLGNEKRYLSKAGESVWVKMTAKLAARANDESAEIFALIEDKAQREESEAESFADIDALKESHRHLYEFSRLASHDLKEPLNTILGYLSFITDQHMRASVSDIEAYLKCIERAAQRGRALTDNLLAYAHLDELKPEFERVDLNAEIAEVLQTMQSLTHGAKASVLVEDLPTVKGDRCQLSRLFQNLIANAIKYSCSDQRDVRLTSRLRGNFWVISVSDNGVGIADKYLEEIFLPFRRGGPPASVPGTGLGLSICKKIAEMHGGVIWVESTSSAGTVFSVSIPVMEVENADFPRLVSVCAQGGSQRIAVGTDALAET